jgi:hypothetical protein
MAIFSIIVNPECQVCGKKLITYGIKSDEQGDKTLIIVPCENCLKEAYEDGKYAPENEKKEEKLYKVVRKPSFPKVFTDKRAAEEWIKKQCQDGYAKEEDFSIL